MSAGVVKLLLLFVVCLTHNLLDIKNEPHISRVPDQNGVSQAYVVEIHHSGRKPSIVRNHQKNGRYIFFQTFIISLFVEGA